MVVRKQEGWVYVGKRVSNMRVCLSRMWLRCLREGCKSKRVGYVRVCVSKRVGCAQARALGVHKQGGWLVMRGCA
eukprot:scaffold86595_cov18-Tisochrysis_lutea.AAC.3